MEVYKEMIKCYLRQIMAEKKIDDIIDIMRATNISRAPISKLYKEEDINTVKFNIILKLCDYLDCKLSDLIEYIPDKK